MVTRKAFHQVSFLLQTYNEVSRFRSPRGSTDIAIDIIRHLVVQYASIYICSLSFPLSIDLIDNAYPPAAAQQYPR